MRTEREVSYEKLLRQKVENGWKPLKGVLKNPTKGMKNPINLNMSREELLKTEILEMSAEQEEALQKL